MIIGHEKIINFFDRVLKNDRVNHAYIFVGPEHVGKSKVAQWLASNLVGISEEKLVTYPDLTILQRARDEDGVLASSIPIEAVRKLRGTLQLSSFLNSWKIVIIEDADTLTVQAANGLLKILEEPHPKTCFILLAKHLESMPATVVSRSQIIHFERVQTEFIFQALRKQGADDSRARVIAQSVYGLPGRALDFLANPEQYEAYKTNAEALGHLSDMSIAERFLQGAKLLEDQEIRGIVDMFLFMLHNQTLLHYNCKDLAIRELFPVSRKNPVPSLRQALQYKEWLQYNVSKNLVLENILLNL